MTSRFAQRWKKCTTSRHIDTATIKVHRALLVHLAPNDALYLTVLLHLDDCARTDANVFEPGSYNGWFWVQREEIYALAAISYKRQLVAQTALRDLGVLRVKRSGMPARKYFYLNVDQLLNLFGVEHGELRPQTTVK